MNRLLVSLVFLIALMQGLVVYKQYREPNTLPSRPLPPNPADLVVDAPKNAIIDLAGLPTKGGNAKIAIVEFSDYECPFCARHANGVARQLEEKYVSSGHIRYAFANNPLAIHPNARFLATAAICAGKQGHYWEMHDRLFSVQSKTKDQIASIAKDLGLNAVAFEECVDRSPEPAKAIQRDAEIAGRFGLTGTPSFSVGVVDDQGRLHVRKFIRGALPLDTFENALKEVGM